MAFFSFVCDKYFRKLDARSIPKRKPVEKTLMLIKPDAIQDHHVGSIISLIEREGFTLLGMKMFTFTHNLAEQFYKIHEAKSFFPVLMDYITSGPCIAILLKREEAVSYLRKIMGATNPVEADEGTIRKRFAVDKTRNAVHGSDSLQSAAKEIALIFGR